VNGEILIMFTHFIAKNFRCFAGIHLQNLSRVNLISGKNNTGKTALLEAIHLHTYPNDCDLPVSINRVRGIEGSRKAFSEVVSWLFYGRHAEVGLELSSFDEKGINRALSMFLVDAATARQRFPDAVKSLMEALPGGQWHSLLGGLLLRYEQAGEPPHFSWVAPNPYGGLMSLAARVPWSIPSIYLGSGMPSREHDVRFFGELEAAKRQTEVIPPLQILEPRLQRLALVPLAGSPSFHTPTTTTPAPVSSGTMSSPSPGFQPAPVFQTGEPVIHGDIGLPRMIPMPLMGEGVRRVLSIVLAIANAPGGVVLMDEIENGLHYSVQKDVWKAIAHAARQANAQIFATTHSWECIEAAHHAFKEAGPYEFRYYRLDRRGEEISVKSLDERMLDTVEKSDLEVR
jgi:hypothetical protein